MQKSILFALLCGVAVFAVACGSGNNSNKPGNSGGSNSADGGNGGDGKAADDAMAFYKKVGNFTLTKTTSKMKMGDKWEDQAATFTRMEVTKVDGTKSTYKMTTYDKDMKETYSAEQPIDFAPKDAPASDAPAAPKPVEEDVTVKAGTFKCLKTEAAGSTSWSHKGMSVKMVMKSDTMDSTTELQEYKCE